MMRMIVGSSLKFRYLILAIALSLIYFGVTQFRDTPVDVFPEFAPPTVEIQTPCLGLSPEEVEALVTTPLEQVLAGVPDLDVIRSKSVPQLSSIKMIFNPGTDLLLARQMVQERVSLATPSLPTWASPPFMLPPLSATSRCMKIGISSEKYSVIDLSMITYWSIRQRLLRVPGVANIAIWGERLEMLQVQVIPELLQKHNVSLEDVMTATADSLNVGLIQFSSGHYIGTGGWIDTPNQRLPIRHILPIIYKSGEVSPEALANIVLTKKNGVSLLLSDVAEVVVDHQPMVGDAIINDGEGLLLIVEKFPWGNTLEVSKGVEEALDAMRPGLTDISIDSEIFRPATFIEMAMGNLTTALIIAGILVVLILFAFLYEWRVALISCTAIPLSLFIGGLVLQAFNATINTMILAGFFIALGAVVDDGIVLVENVVRRLRQYRKEGKKASFSRIIVDASLEVRRAIIDSTLIEISAVLPVFFMEGLSGAFFQPLVIAYSVAIASSTLVALTIVPAMSFILLRDVPLEERESPFVKWIQKGYHALLAKIVKNPMPVYTIVGVVVLSGLIILPQLGQSLLPDFKERDFLMHWLTKPGTSWPEMNRITIQGSKELRQIPGVRNFGAHIGQALIMDEVVGMYFGENWISVDPSVDYDETVAKIQETVDGYPGLFRDVLTYLKERIREVLTGTSEAIVVRIYGNDLDIIHSKAKEVKKAFEDIEGIIDLHVELHEEIPQIEVKVDLEKAKKYGVKPGDVRRASAILVAGEEAGDIHIGNRTYDIQVWSVPEARGNLTNIEELLIDLPEGGFVQLKDVADVRVAATPNVIEHENLKRRIDVGANVRGRDLGSVYADVEAALDTISFPNEYYPDLLGEYTERQAVEQKLFLFAIVAIILIFLFLHRSVGSTSLAVMFLFLLIISVMGGVVAAFIGDGIISLGSLVGFLTVLGIATRNGILLITHFQHLEKHEGMTFGIPLILRGAKEKLAPILMTAATTSLALVPIIVAGNIPGHEIEHPMAVVIVGGLITSTLLDLFVTPSLYLMFGKKFRSKSEAIKQAE